MDEFKELLGAKKQHLSINLEKPREILCRGLRYFIGDDAKWLQGYDEIAEWLQDNKGKGLMLYGSNGRGKSVMCYNILPTVFQYYLKQVKTFKCRANNLHLIQSDKTDYYSMLCAQVNGTIGDMTDVYPFDVAHRTENKAFIDQMFTPTIRTPKNLGRMTPDEIRDRYGIRTLDRLRAITRAICLNGKSMRENQENANKQ